jgi:Flp pilus assembly protein TadB
LAIPVLLILAVLWAAVLVPPVLRSRSESRRGFGDFTSRLGALTRRHSSSQVAAGPARHRQLRPVPSSRSTTARAHAMSPAQKRRRDVLIILVGAAVVTLGLAVLVDPMLWIGQAVVDVLLAVYLSLLVLVKRGGSLAFAATDTRSAPAPRSRSGALAHPRVPARPELAALPAASPASQRRTAAG